VQIVVYLFILFFIIIIAFFVVVGMNNNKWTKRCAEMNDKETSTKKTSVY